MNIEINNFWYNNIWISYSLCQYSDSRFITLYLCKKCITITLWKYYWNIDRDYRLQYSLNDMYLWLVFRTIDLYPHNKKDKYYKIKRMIAWLQYKFTKTPDTFTN
mgnify:CR=1 FL=1